MPFMGWSDLPGPRECVGGGGLTQDMREVALNIGWVIKMLAVRYDLDLPTPIANDRLDLEAAGLKKNKKLGLQGRPSMGAGGGRSTLRTGSAEF